MAKKERLVELIAVHAYMTIEDYLSPEAYAAKIGSLFGKIDAARAKNSDGTHKYAALACFPEVIGSFLGLAGRAKEIRGASTMKEAMARVAPKVLHKIVRNMILHGTVSLNEAMFLTLGRRMHEIHFTVFSRLAKQFNLYVNAGSLLLPVNKLGDNEAGFKAASRRIYNTSHTFDPTGACINVTRKVNVVPTMEDVLDMSGWPPEKNHLFDTPMGRVGVAICYDGFREPHTEKEPDFVPLAVEYDKRGADVIVMPSANPWFWDEPWVFNAPGEHLYRREQWMCEGLLGSMEKMKRVRYGVNPHLVGSILDAHFDGRSYILERAPSGEVRTVAESARSAIAPETEEILCVTVPALG